MNIRDTLIYLMAAAVMTPAYTCGQDRRSQDCDRPKYKLEIVDQPEKLRFRLILTSTDNRDICIHFGIWPDSEGRTETGPDVYSIRTDEGIIYPHPPTVEIDCWDADCVTRVGPGESLNGFIAYSEFGDPSKIRSLRKRELRAHIVPSVCESITGDGRKNAVPSTDDPEPASSPKSAITPNE